MRKSCQNKVPIFLARSDSNMPRELHADLISLRGSIPVVQLFSGRSPQPTASRSVSRTTYLQCLTRISPTCCLSLPHERLLLLVTVGSSSCCIIRELLTGQPWPDSGYVSGLHFSRCVFLLRRPFHIAFQDFRRSGFLKTSYI